MQWILWILILKVYGALTFSTIQTEPALTQTTRAFNYVGSLYTVRFLPSPASIGFVWTVTDTLSVFTFAFLPLSSTDCSNSGTITSGGFTASCTGTETTLSATVGITSSYSITLTGTVDGSSISGTLRTEVIPATCNLDRSFSTVLTANTVIPGFCDYNCAITYQCISGYIALSGLTTYTARCGEYATVTPSEQCFLQNASSTSSTGLPVWGIVLIALGGFAVLAACLLLVWKFCKRRPVAVST